MFSLYFSSIRGGGERGERGVARGIMHVRARGVTLPHFVDFEICVYGALGHCTTIMDCCEPIFLLYKETVVEIHTSFQVYRIVICMGLL